jgi:hypothetical protein
MSRAEDEEVEIGPAYMFLGIVYNAMGNREKAIEELNNAIEYFAEDEDVFGMSVSQVLSEQIDKEYKE